MNGKKPNNVQKIVSVFILWCMTVGSIAGIFTAGIGSGSVPQPVTMLVPSVINGITIEVIDQGIVDVDSSITVMNNGGVLRIVNSTLNFPQDDSTDYFIHVTTGGSLILENSTITTGATPTASWDPMFEITFTDSTLKMTDHSVLAFPGLLDITGINSHVFINDSWITSLEPTDFFTTYADNFPTFKGVVNSWWTGTTRDLEDWQDDGPVMSFVNCDDVTIADSRIDELYEDSGLAIPTQNIQIYPDALAVNEGTGGLGAVQHQEGSYYLLNYLIDSTPEISAQFTPTFIDPTWTDQNFNILAAYLYVLYNNPGYNYATTYDTIPWNCFNISVPGSVPETPVFQINENMATDWAEEWEITSQVSSFDQIDQMNVNFTAYEFGANNPINIDIIAINLTIMPLHPAAAQACCIVADNSEISVINSYIGADWTSTVDNYEAKNAIALTNGANLYLYNATISEDEGGIPGIEDYLEIPLGANPADYVPVRVAAGCEAYYFKWLDASVVDRYDAAIPGARLNATFDFTDPTTVNTVSKINNLFDYTGPNEWDWAKLRVTDYLNRMYGTVPASFNITAATGKVMLPLLTTYFDSAYYPNGDHVGEYNVNIFYTGSAGAYTPCDFMPMPNIAAEDNTIAADIQLTDVELVRPFGSPGLIVNATTGDQTFDGGVSDSLAISDFIIVEDTATLTISNANLLLSPTGAAPFHITVRDSGVLILNNVDLRTLNNQYLQITLEDDATLNMTDSSTLSVIDMLAKDNVQVNFNRTEIGGNFDTTDGANVRLNAWSTMFSRSLDDLHGTTEARLIGCYSPLSPNFKIEPSDSAKVWNYRWAEITVYNGQTPAKTLLGANIWIATQFPGWEADLNRAGTTNVAGIFLTPALSDYIHYDQASSEVVESHYNLYTLVTEYQLAGGSGIVHNETTGLGLAAFPLMGLNDAIAKKSVVLENVLPDLDPPITVWPPLAGGSGVGRGNTILINATVTNAGDATATNAAIRFQDIFNGQITQIYTDIKASLAPGEEWDVSFPYTWSSVSQIGWHNVTVMVDPNLLIKEQDETNNGDYILIEVTSQADLAMLQYTDVRASETYPLVNEAFNLYANIWNQGDINASDVLVSFYANGVLLGNATAADVPANPAVPTVVTLPVTFTMNGTYRIEVYIDPLNQVSEVNEANNNNTMWPFALRVYNESQLFLQTLQVIDSTNLVELASGGGTAITETYNRTRVALRARVGNQGDLYASNVFVRFYDGPVTAANLIGTSNYITRIDTDNFAYATYIWEALTDSLEEIHTINAIAYADAGLVSNQLSQTLTVYDNRADLELVGVALANNATTLTGNTAFSLNVTIINNGLWTARDVAVDIYSSMDNYNSSKAAWNSNNKVPIGRIGNATITTLVTGETTTLSIRCTGINTGDNELFIYVDTELNNTDAIDYDDVTHIIGDVEEYDETNNNISWAVTALMPPLFINIQIPSPTSIAGVWTQVFTEGDVQTVQISGYVLRLDDPNIGVPDVPVTVTVEGITPMDVTTVSGGFFSATMAVSATGNYTVEVSGDGISTATSWFRIDPATIFPWWIIILIIVLVVAIIVGITLYLYFVGLGKTVQCGDCGAFIPEGAAKCPKCGVEFEKEVAKCSVCGAWVPIDVKNCPECKTEFTVGTEDLDDYEAKMKRQYDDIVRKFRNEAKKELGQEFTETEFQAWWAAKPTFITFDQWLKEEEEMKRMGSKPCPVCETENSVTAKICHKCGSVMGEAKQPKKPEGKMPPAEKKPEPAKPAQPQPKQQPPPTRTAPAPLPAQPQPTQQAAPAAAAPVPAQQATPGKKGCPSCGMEVNAAEKICPICNYDFSQAQTGEARRIIRKPIKKIVRRPGEPGGNQPQQ